MGFRLKVTGGKDIEMNETILTAVQFISETPDDANARSTDLGVNLKISGRINFSLGAELADATVDVASWALMPSDQADCYRNVQIQVVSGGPQRVRNGLLGGFE